MTDTVKMPQTDILKWMLVFIVLILALGGYYIFKDHSTFLRVGGLLVAVVIASFIGYNTLHGKKFWEFALASKQEIRKVVWPARQETIQSSLLVLVMVVVLGLLLWGVDTLLLRLVAWVTGRGGI